MKTFIATLVLSFATVAMFTGCSSEQTDTDVPEVPTEEVPDAPETDEAPAAPDAPEAP